MSASNSNTNTPTGQPQPPEGSPAWREEQRRQRQEQLRQLGERIFTRLGELGVSKISVGFDGFGDDGQIEYMRPTMQAKGTGIVLKRAVFEGRTLYKAVEELIHGQLDTGHAGWQNEGGSCGTYTLDVAARKIREKFVAREDGGHDASAGGDDKE